MTNSLDDILRQAAQAGAVIMIQNLTINTGDTYHAQNIAVGGGATVNVGQAAMSADGRGMSLSAPNLSRPSLYERRRAVPELPADHFRYLPEVMTERERQQREEYANRYGG